ncbi:hypothetical protein CTEN210_12026 [Chaetoceros tenuissimus]|uniref:Leucine-rich repeat domain-containing protein n=1 Tax=Chaetoceros tenuissimus TaxID=426638 RepID=A0AAD3H9P0_9STRA|nr:hypothetical protein CTEN210_12026 [Chaetoceros tenuissimus]
MQPQGTHGAGPHLDVDALSVQEEIGFIPLDFERSEECDAYWDERQTWQQVIIEEGVTVIPYATFERCKNIKRVIFANTVVRIEEDAFYKCKDLIYIKLSISLLYIGEFAFEECDLSSVFIPPRCREIGNQAFADNKKLLIFNVLHRIEIQRSVLLHTKLVPFRSSQNLPITDFVMNVNGREKYVLHRACCSFEPSVIDIVAILQEKGLGTLKEKNGIGITPLQYLNENPYTDITEYEIIQLYTKTLIGM